MESAFGRFLRGLSPCWIAVVVGLRKINVWELNDDFIRLVIVADVKVVMSIPSNQRCNVAKSQKVKPELSFRDVPCM